MFKVFKECWLGFFCIEGWNKGNIIMSGESGMFVTVVRIRFSEQTK